MHERRGPPVASCARLFTRSGASRQTITLLSSGLGDADAAHGISTRGRQWASPNVDVLMSSPRFGWCHCIPRVRMVKLFSCLRRSGFHGRCVESMAGFFAPRQVGRGPQYGLPAAAFITLDCDATPAARAGRGLTRIVSTPVMRICISLRPVGIRRRGVCPAGASLSTIACRRGTPPPSGASNSSTW